ncbi:MAG: T9SS type A sorting domain-containing protein [Chitinophagaceae bacterium]|nr:T9SS type A sorting domain-containing protein [Chitinophagaceae bacterium]
MGGSLINSETNNNAKKEEEKKQTAIVYVFALFLFRGISTQTYRIFDKKMLIQFINSQNKQERKMKKIGIIYIAMILLIVSKRENIPTIDTGISHFYAQKKGDSKLDGIAEFMKFHQSIRTPEGETKNGYPYGYQMKELQKAEKYLAQQRVSSTNFSWVNRGPYNVPGRTRTMLVMPQDASGSTWIVGAVGGGIWKTTNKGVNWTNLTPNIPNLAISSLSISASNADIIYAGTGEESFGGLGGIRGDGILKSSNAGTTWTLLSSTANENFGSVSRVIVDPTNTNIALASTTKGVFKTTDGGNSWIQTLAKYNADQIVYSPGNFSIQYTTVKSDGIYKSVNAGDTWTHYSPGMIPTGRIEMAISPVNPQKIFAAVLGNQTKINSTSTQSTGEDLYFSTDAGETWRLATSVQTIPFLGGQGWYDNSVTAHPFDENTVYVAGVSSFKFTITPEASSPKTVFQMRITKANPNDYDFVDFVSTSGNVLAGVSLGTNAPSYINVEIRIGRTLRQKAHRFTVGNRGSGVPAANYTYRDYIEVPFQVWDTENNRQLMISFRDQQDDGKFNLLPLNTTTDFLENSREYLYIHNIEYRDIANLSISTNGGQENALYLNIWMVLAENQEWNENTLPEFTISLQKKKQYAASYRTTVIADGYGQFSTLSGGVVINLNKYIHVDHHSLTISNKNTTDKTFRLIDTNDGGIFYTSLSTKPGELNGDWTNAGYGYVTGQFYGVDKKPGKNNFNFIGGLQDNNTVLYNNSLPATDTTKYTAKIGGDGFQTVWNYANANEMIGGFQFNGFGKSKDGGKTFYSAIAGMTPEETDGKLYPFYSKLENIKSNPHTLYTVSTEGVYRSDNFGDSWKLNPINTIYWQNGFGSFMDVCISQANPSIVWAGGRMSSSARLFVSKNGGYTFDTIPNYSIDKTLRGSFSGIATHPTEDSTAYLLFSFAKKSKIIRTKNLGKTWEDISRFSNGSSQSGFPDIAVYSLLVLKNSTGNETILAGTEVGIFETQNDGVLWTITPNFPRVSVFEIKLVDDQIVLATHGRGIWTAAYSEVPTVTFVPKITGVGMNPSGKIAGSISFLSDFDSTDVFVKGKKIAKIGNTPANSTKAFSFQYLSLLDKDTFFLYATSYKQGKPYKALPYKTIYQKNATILTYITEYENDFNNPTKWNDFLGDFEVKTVYPFANPAIHSPHPYTDGYIQYTHTLKYPLIVSNGLSIFYKNIAIIEGCVDSIAYDDPDFCDYVIVEGTKDGVTWKPLLKGYNSLAHNEWKEIMQTWKDPETGEQRQGSIPDVNTWKITSIVIQPTFNPGDTILLRLRIHSDQYSYGWGWTIDDITINTRQTPILHTTSFTNTLSIYPNPTTDYIIIKSPLKIKGYSIYNTSGQLILHNPQWNLNNREASIDIKKLKQGNYTLILFDEYNTILKTEKIIKK